MAAVTSELSGPDTQVSGGSGFLLSAHISDPHKARRAAVLVNAGNGLVRVTVNAGRKMVTRMHILISKTTAIPFY